MSKPIIALKDSCKNEVPTNDKTNACHNKVFYMTAELDTNKGKSFVVNNPDGDAKLTLYFAKIIDLKGFEKCKAEGSDTCIVHTKDGDFTYEKMHFDKTEVELEQCTDIETGLVTSPCISTIEAGDFYVLEEPFAPTKEEAEAYNNVGDYHRALIDKCKEQGAHLASAAEIKASGKFKDTYKNYRVVEFYGGWLAYLYEPRNDKTRTQPTNMDYAGICIAD